jgi:5-methylcytosine-specific restriction enzyme subunit McrC
MNGSSRRTLYLTERVPRLVRLSPADVAFLLERHAAHLELAPTGKRHHYRLTPRGHVGVVVAPGCRLVIRPKIPLDDLFYLLDPTTPLPAVSDRVAPTAGDEVLDFLAGQLACRLADLAAAGLHRGYREVEDHGPLLHGRVDVAAQLRDGPARKDRLHCRYEDFTADMAWNQVLKATAETLLASAPVRDGVRTALRRAVASLEGVQAASLDENDWPRLEAARLPERYRMPLDLCRLLLEGLGPGPSAGPVRAPAFLLDMERVWERHVTRMAFDAFAGGDEQVVVQQWRTIGHDAEGRSLSIRPDVTIEHAGRTLLVLDAKWKRPGDQPAPDDLYQVLTYAATLRAPAAVLVYPRRRSRHRAYTFPNLPVRLAVWSLGVGGTREECTRSAKRLGKALRALTSDCQRL